VFPFSDEDIIHRYKNPGPYSFFAAYHEYSIYHVEEARRKPFASLDI
jgi:hypothetical protein